MCVKNSMDQYECVEDDSGIQIVGNEGGTEGGNEGGVEGGNLGGVEGGNLGGEEGGTEGGSLGGEEGGTEGGILGGVEGGNLGGEEGGTEGGVLGGVEGGNLGGVEGGNLGGVEGGNLGGVEGGNLGGIEGGILGGAVGGNEGGTEGGQICLSTDEICDAQDNDCDGEIDESLAQCQSCLRVILDEVELPSNLIISFDGQVGQETRRTLYLESCGERPLSIDSIEVNGDGFRVESMIETFPFQFESSPDNSPNRLALTVLFEPQQVGTFMGEMILNSNAVDQDVFTLQFVGTALETNLLCPIPQISQNQVDAVITEEILLDGSFSQSRGQNPITGYTWAIIQRPEGSTATINDRGAGSPLASFRPDQAGEYRIELSVTTQNQLTSPSDECPIFNVQNQIQINAFQTNPTGLNLELTWNTPRDPNQNDGMGTDMDIHFLNRSLGSQWSRGPADCYYASRNPDWGEAGVEHNPELVLDDVNGAGPEIIQADSLENSILPYEFGVYYYSSGGTFGFGTDYGPSSATAKVYFDGTLLFELDSEAMNAQDFWIPAHVFWQNDAVEVVEVNRLYRMISNLNNFEEEMCTATVEVCDGVDNDCDGQSDEGLTECTSCIQVSIDSVEINQEEIISFESIENEPVFKTLSLENCGTRPAVIQNIEVEGDAFQIDLDNRLLPLVIPEPEGQLHVTLSFDPQQSEIHTGRLEIESNDLDDPVFTSVLFGTHQAISCPNPVASLSQNLTSVGTPLILDGSLSTSDTAELISYEWVIIERPVGSMSQVLESQDDNAAQIDDPSTPTALFIPDLIGRYTFELRVTDSEGSQSPGDACRPPQNNYRVSADVIDQQPGLRIELTWNTPADMDQTDNLGTDLDLYLLNRSLGDQWGRPPNSCSYRNPTPNWGDSGPIHNPTLVLDDVDGQGPEIIEADSLANSNRPYEVGVHYFSSQTRTGIELGESVATVKIFLLGDLVFEEDSPNLSAQNFWVPAQINWENDQPQVLTLDRLYMTLEDADR